MNIGTVEKHRVCIRLVGVHTENYGFLCKEICLLDCNSNYMFHTTVKLTLNMDEWTSQEEDREFLHICFLHGLGIDCGAMDIDKMIRKVSPIIQNKTVIVKEKYEAEWVKNTFNRCGPIECVLMTHTNQEKRYSMFDTQQQLSVCDYHPPRESGMWGQCARRSAFDLKKTVCQIDSLISDVSNTFCLQTMGYNLYSNGYVCKEICLAHLGSDFIFHTTVKTPAKKRKFVKEYRKESSEQASYGIDLRQLKKQIIPILKGKRIIITNNCYTEVIEWFMDIFDGYYIEITIIGNWFRNWFLDRERLPDCNYHYLYTDRGKGSCAKELVLNAKQALLYMQNGIYK